MLPARLTSAAKNLILEKGAEGIKTPCKLQILVTRTTARAAELEVQITDKDDLVLLTVDKYLVSEGCVLTIDGVDRLFKWQLAAT